MSRRKSQIFNLSLLDLLTSALGAIIFLFIITPKGGESASESFQASVYFDTTQMKIHGDLHDSLLSKQAGDTLFTVLVSYKNLPKKEEAPKRVFAFNDNKESLVQKEKEINKPPEVKKEEKPEPKKEKVKEKPKEQPTTKEEKKPEKVTTLKPVAYKGDAPSVPCKVSIEINWANKDDNIDLFVCKGTSCVYGGRKKDKKVGQWDSGKSRNRLFGNDLRTNQEAVRQFDDIIPGEYKIYAQFKESKSTKKTVVINGLIYTKDDKNNERGEAFTKLLRIGEDRILVGTIVLQENGLYHFKKS